MPLGLDTELKRAIVKTIGRKFQQLDNGRVNSARSLLLVRGCVALIRFVACEAQGLDRNMYYTPYIMMHRFIPSARGLPYTLPCARGFIQS